MRDQLFIAYSHWDVKWLERLKGFLKPLSRKTHIQLHEDNPGGVRSAAVKESLASAKVCLLLVSDDLLESKLMSVLLPLLGAVPRKEIHVLWVPLTASDVKRTEIYKYKAAINPTIPLDMVTAKTRDSLLSEVVTLVASLLEEKPRAAKGRVAAMPKPAEPKPAGAARKSAAKRAAVKSAAKSPATPAASEPDARRSFVCYARADEGFALELATDLKDGGVNVWIDQWDIPSGADWDYEIDRALYDCHHFLIILSPSAVESEEVRAELRIALDEHKRIVPVLYLPCRVPRRLRLIQHIDCTEAAGGRSERAMRLMLRALGR